MAKRFTRRLAGVVLALSAFGAWAQAFPSKPIRAIIPYAPGSGVDVVARIVGEAVAKNLGQPFVAEQKIGAGGTIATAYVATAPADGYTLLFDSSAHTSVPAVTPNLPFDTARDFSGVTTLIENPLVMVTGQSRGFKTIAELVATGKAKPGSINYSSAGFGTSSHISAEKFRIATNLQAVHVPFKSTTDAITEILGGRMDFTYTALTSALAGIRDGRLVALAMSARRSSLLPNVPTIAEAGYPDAAYSSWVGMVVSSKTPRDIVNRLYQETVKALAQPDIVDRLAKIGAEPNTMTPDEFDALRRRELADNMQVMKASGIKLQ